MNGWQDIPRGTVIGALWAYKRFLSPLIPPACRFYPTCSEYAMEAFRTHKLGRAAWLSARRLVRCGPWSAGGFDPVPDPPTGRRPDTERNNGNHDDPERLRPDS